MAFRSSATNLVPGDTNGKADIFVYDRQTDTIERVSLAADGTQGNDASSAALDQRRRPLRGLCFDASNLVPGDTNGQGRRLRVRPPDGHDRAGERCGRRHAGKRRIDVLASISADGRYVAFGSIATNLVPGDTNAKADIFVYDRQTDTIERVSVAADGTQGNDASTGASISADGRYVAFDSTASNLVPGDTNGQERRLRLRSPDGHDRASEPRCRRHARKRRIRLRPRSAPTAAMWRLTRPPATSSPATPMPRTTSSCTTARRTRSQRVSLAADGTQGNGDSPVPCDQRRRPLCGVLLDRQQPRPRRYQWRRATPSSRANPFAWSSRNHVVVLAAGQDVSGIDFGNHDIAPPTLSSLAPADDATGVGVEPNLVITLNEDIQKGTGNIVIKKSSDNSVVETIDVNSLQVTLCDTTATIDPSDDVGGEHGLLRGGRRRSVRGSFGLRLRGDQWSHGLEFYDRRLHRADRRYRERDARPAHQRGEQYHDRLQRTCHWLGSGRPHAHTQWRQ